MATIDREGRYETNTLPRVRPSEHGIGIDAPVSGGGTDPAPTPRAQ